MVAGSGTPAVAIETTSYTGSSWNLAAVQSLPREVARAVPTGKRIVLVGVGDNGVTAVDKTAEVFIP